MGDFSIDRSGAIWSESLGEIICLPNKELDDLENTIKEVRKRLIIGFHRNFPKSELDAPEPHEGDKKPCPECKEMMTWVCLGEPEGDFYSCECGFDCNKDMKTLSDLELENSETKSNGGENGSNE